MVEQVTAFRDSSGALHPTQLAAARANAKLLLEKILGRNEDAVSMIMASPLGVYEALEPFVEAIKEHVGKPLSENFDEARYPSCAQPASHSTKEA